MAARLGVRAEWLALALLWLKGYRLRHRRWRGPAGELDLVMEHRGVLVFVEVKARSSSSFGGAAGAVDRAKRERLISTASVYLSRFSLWQRPSRFDVVTFERSGGLLGWRLRHYRDAFAAAPGRRL